MLHLDGMPSCQHHCSNNQREPDQRVPAEMTILIELNGTGHEPGLLRSFSETLREQQMFTDCTLYARPQSSGNNRYIGTSNV